MSNCAVCHKLVKSGIVVHSECVYGLVKKTQQLDNNLLTIEELRDMPGEPAWCEEYQCWGIVKCEAIGKWANKPFLVGAWHDPYYKTAVNFEYDIEARELTLYRHKHDLSKAKS